MSLAALIVLALHLTGTLVCLVACLIAESKPQPKQ